MRCVCVCVCVCEERAICKHRDSEIDTVTQTARQTQRETERSAGRLKNVNRDREGGRDVKQ